jgi:hypothetical protein
MKTTSDCKKFLVDFFKKTPNLLTKIYGDDDIETQNLAYSKGIISNNWSRTWKGKPKSNNSYINGDYAKIYVEGEIYSRGPEYGPFNNILTSDIAVERHFSLKREIFDSSICYVVIENHSGDLFLGEYIGD